jgi:hypothetical protein
VSGRRKPRPNLISTRRQVEGPAVLRRALEPAAPLWPERRAYPWRPLRGRRPRAFLRELASIVARGFWMEAYPCCLAHRYGHGWQRVSTTPLTVDGGPINYALLKWHPGWRIVGIQAQRRYAGAVVVTDYVLVEQGPPVPCPTCGTRPPRRQLDAWNRYVTLAVAMKALREHLP